jgi:hypothetical protein
MLSRLGFGTSVLMLATDASVANMPFFLVCPIVGHPIFLFYAHRNLRMDRVWKTYPRGDFQTAWDNNTLILFLEGDLTVQCVLL